ncbi:MAG: hypothetical protein ACE5J9_08955 [Methanosarcinales archaeon]
MKGIVISTVGWLIIAIVAVIFLLIFFSKLVPTVGDFMDSIVKGLKSAICNLIPWYAKWIFGC